MKLLSKDRKLSQHTKNLIADIKSKTLSQQQIIQKYGMKDRTELHATTRKLRIQGLIPPSSHSERMKKAWATRKENGTTHTTKGMKFSKTTESSSSPILDYRTVYFKDFTVQIHKKAMARLVVDHNNNLHILNS